MSDPPVPPVTSAADPPSPAVATTATEATTAADAAARDPVAAGPAVAAVERGMLLMAAGVLIVPGIDALAKLLAQEIPVPQVVWSRVVFHTLFLGLAALALRRSLRLPRGRAGLVIARGLLIATATGLFFTALRVMPLADAIAIFFVMPLLLTVLAALFLGEPIGWRRVTAILAGLGGAMLVIRPSFAEFGVTALFPLAAALCFAIYLTITRRLAGGIEPVALEFLGTATAAALVSGALAVGHLADIGLLAPVAPSPRQWLMMAALGGIACLGHLLIVQAFVRAPAGVLAPFQYLEIVGAVTLGYLVFGDFPDAATWAGVAIIVGAGLYVFHRERRLARAAPAAAPMAAGGGDAA